MWGWGCRGGDRKDPLQRHAQPALGTAALEAPPPSQQLSSRPFCSPAANDAIKFIRRTSVLNDRTTGCPLREAGLKQLKEPGGARDLKTIPADFISKLNRKYSWSLCWHLRTEVCSCHRPSLSRRALTTQSLTRSFQPWSCYYVSLAVSSASGPCKGSHADVCSGATPRLRSEVVWD